MGLPSGLGSSFGFATEVTYGTYVEPTKWIECSQPQLRKTKNTVQGGAMTAGGYGRRGSMRNVTTKAGGGTINTEVFSKRMGLLLNALMGGTVTPVQNGATTAYTQTHSLGDPTGKYLTMQVGVPDLGGTARPYTFLGSKITAMEFSCGIDENLTVAITVDSRDVTEAETLAAPSYATGVNVFHFGQAALKLGTYDSEAAIQGVRRVTLRIERPSRVDRFYMGNSGLKSNPVINDYVNISGTIDWDYITKADIADRFAADTSTALDWVFTGPEIDTGEEELFRIRCPQIFFDTDTPVVDGPDIVTGSYNFVARDDGTNGIGQIIYVSADTAL